MQRLVLVCLVVFLGFSPMGAWAQDDPPFHEKSLPIEIAMLYKKLLKEEPNYNQIIYSNPAYIADPLKFGQAALVEQQRVALEKIYEQTGLNKLIYDQRDILYVGYESDGTVHLAEQDPDMPVIFTLFENEKYGVFIRNLKDIELMKPPFVVSEPNQVGSNTPVFVELTLKPVAADPQDSVLADGTRVKTIITDVVEARLLPGDPPFIAVQKRFNDWTPNPVQTSSALFQPEMLESLNKKKNDQ